jgi:putative oxidoreductase
MTSLRIPARVALLPLRLLVGFGFFAHGLAKWNRGPEKFAVLLQHVGVPFPGMMAWIGTITELTGGIALLLGIAVTFASVPLIVMMLVAMLSIHIHYGFSSINTIGITAAGPQFGPPGYEINLLYIAALIALGASGPTVLSVDRRIARAREED